MHKPAVRLHLLSGRVLLALVLFGLLGLGIWKIHRETRPVALGTRRTPKPTRRTSGIGRPVSTTDTPARSGEAPQGQPSQQRTDTALLPPGSGTTVLAPSRWPSSCSQPDLEAEADRVVAERLGRVAAVELPPAPRREPDWAGLARFVDALFHRVPRAPKWARSLRAFRNARIRYAPDPKADEVGMLAHETRLPLMGWVRGRGCPGGWMAVGIHAYVCRIHLVFDRRPPEANELPVVPEGQLTPGQYAYVRAGGAPLYPSRKAAKQNKPARTLPMGFFLRFKRFCRINGRNYWKTTKNWYVPVDRLARHVPSKFSGVILDRGGLGLPVAFSLRKKRIYDRPGGRAVGELPRHGAVQVLGVLKKRGRTYYRVGPCRWIRAGAVRVAWPAAPPPGVHSGEKWVDINLARQVLVAYEGKRPIYATMISSGRDDHPTQHGIFRSYWKVAETDMTNEMGAAEEYMAESVPWSLFFWKGQALHGAYWHDMFGIQKSHGCVNLSPLDARFLYEWSDPKLPPGWLYRFTGVRFPGLLVQVRRYDGDMVRYLGIARKLAPQAEVKRRDELYKKRLEEEYLKSLQEKSKTEEPEKQPAPAPGKATKAAQGASARKAAAPRRASRKS